MKLNWNVLGKSQVEWNMTGSFLATDGHGEGRYKDMDAFSMDPRILFNIVLEPQAVAAGMSLSAFTRISG